MGVPAEDQAYHAQSLAAVLALADAIGRTIFVARQLIEGGRQVDLAGFDGGIGLLCAKVLDLQPETGRMLRGRLIALLEDLDAMHDLVLRQQGP